MPQPAFFDDIQRNKAITHALRERSSAIAVGEVHENAHHEIWPQARLGALMLALFRESEEMKQAVEAWTAGVFWCTLRTS
jgi:hypothetical protein